MPYGRRLAVFALATALVAACGGGQAAPPPPPKLDEWTQEFLIEFGRQPDSAPGKWRGLIGEYGPDTNSRWFVIERDKRLSILDQYKNYVPLTERSDSVFDAPVLPVPVSGTVTFRLDSAKRALSVRVGNVVMQRRDVGPAEGVAQLRITPVRPIDELRREALAATPPAESGSFRQTDLVDVAALDTSIRLDIRYASENNFLGARMYDAPRAFLQRDAAAALVRANKTIKRLNGVLLIHDAYRPWYVTKIFWDATPTDKRWMVANPAEGSKHNRGIAVDLNIWDRDENKPLDMPSTYDESTERSFVTYPGGTSQQRWNRALLKRVMEHEGFAVHPKEWWHFEYVDRKRYPIGNVAFDKIK